MTSIPGKQNNVNRESLVGRSLHEGAYSIQRVLGHGGMGNVYLALHNTLKIPFALKQARADQPLPDSVIEELALLLGKGRDPSAPEEHQQLEKMLQDRHFPSSGGIHTDRFLREALLLARLDHPAIPGLYDYFFEDGYWYLVMDYIPGPTLNAHMQRYAPLSPMEAICYTMQLCDVLDYLHKQTPPIIFRDLKPSNIIITQDTSLMLVDFGIARYFKEGQITDTMDFGSPGYASPEQYKGEGQTDARSDLYSLGVILREMITGRRVPGAPSANTPDASVVLNGLIKLAMRTEPMYRFQSARSFSLALEHAYRAEERRAYRRAALKASQGAHTGHLRMIEEQANQEDQPRVMVTRKLPQVNLTTKLPVVNPTTKLPQLDLTNKQAAVSLSTSTMVSIPRVQPTASTARSLASPTHKLEQRRRIRETLQQTRLAVPAVAQSQPGNPISLHGQSEIAGLKRQAFTPFTSTARIMTVHADASAETSAMTPLPGAHRLTTFPPPPSTTFKPRKTSRRVQRFIQACFLLALLLFMVMASLLTYAHFFPRSTPTTQGRPLSGSPTGAMNGAPTSSTSGVQPGKLAWHALSSLPSPQADNALVYAQVQGQGYLYMTGGYHGPNQAPHYDRNFYRYNIAASRWENITPANFPGMLNNAGTQDGQGHLFFTGGYSTDSYTISPSLYMYQPNGNSTKKIALSPQLVPGFGGSMIADQHGHLYLTQGFLQAGNPYAQAGTGFYRYDIASDQWTALASLPLGLGYVLLTLDSKNNILLLGGSTDEGQHNQTNHIYRYDTTQNTWTQEPTTLPLAVSAPAGCTIAPNQLILIGGYNAARNASSADVWLLNLQKMSWQSLPSLPVGGSFLGSATCDGLGHLFLERGASDFTHPTTDFWELG